MKSLYLITFILTITVLIGCNSKKNEWQREISNISKQLDSIDMAYQKIDWEYWSQLNNTINSNTQSLSNETELAFQLDTSFITFFGPYSTAGKVISRTLKKSKSQIKEEIVYSKNQLSTLAADIKSKQISNIDSVAIYVEQERKAVQELTFKITSLENSLLHQQHAYDSTHQKVEDVIKKIESIKPNFNKEHPENLILEEPEHD